MSDYIYPAGLIAVLEQIRDRGSRVPDGGTQTTAERVMHTAIGNIIHRNGLASQSGDKWTLTAAGLKAIEDAKK